MARQLQVFEKFEAGKFVYEEDLLTILLTII